MIILTSPGTDAKRDGWRPDPRRSAPMAGFLFHSVKRYFAKNVSTRRPLWPTFWTPDATCRALCPVQPCPPSSTTQLRPSLANVPFSLFSTLVRRTSPAARSWPSSCLRVSLRQPSHAAQRRTAARCISTTRRRWPGPAQPQDRGMQATAPDPSRADRGRGYDTSTELHQINTKRL